MEKKDLLEKTTTLILAGGKGERLMSLTEHRAKPAVIFGGRYRIIDFVLSNCLNSGLSKIFVIVQYKFDSLVRHLDYGWKNIFSTERNEYLRVLPPQMRVGDNWYQGTADAVFQNLYSIRRDKPEYVLILSGDQIYKMNYLYLLYFHCYLASSVTIAATEVDVESAKRFGVLQVNENMEVIGFEEKPKKPKTIPNSDGKCLVSMGIYVFYSDVLAEELEQDMNDKNSHHDFGKDIIPRMLKQGKRIVAYTFHNPCYWRDVGTIDDYFKTSMDLFEQNPPFNLYDENWPWRTFQKQRPPTKITLRSDIREAIISEGCVIDESEIVRSILSPGVKIGKKSQIIESIIMDDVIIEENSIVFKAIIDKNNIIPANSMIESNNMMYNNTFTTTPSGIVIVPRHF
jgi:glucose-1-phosphate adenylyltransferase